MSIHVNAINQLKSFEFKKKCYLPNTFRIIKVCMYESYNVIPFEKYLLCNYDKKIVKLIVNLNIPILILNIALILHYYGRLIVG